MDRQETSGAAASEVGILARRPREHRRWEITQASHHPQRPFTLNIAPQGPDRHGRKYLPGRNVVQEPSNCQTRVSLDRKWLARLRLPQGLGAVLPTAPRTPCNSSIRSPLGLQFPANLAAPLALCLPPKSSAPFSFLRLCTCLGRGRAVTPYAAAARFHSARRLKGGVAIFGLSALWDYRLFKGIPDI